MYAEGVGEECAKRAIAIDAVDGGWIVRVHHPHQIGHPEEAGLMVLAQVLPQINALSVGEAVKEADDSIDSYKRDDEEREAERVRKTQAIVKTIKESFSKQKRGPSTTVHVFADFGKMIDFVENTLNPEKAVEEKP